MILALLMLLGTTSQHAFERCGETHLTVINNLDEDIHVLMFEQYIYIRANESAVFWTNEPVEVDRVTRKRQGQTYHTSSTSQFQTEKRECTFEWATL